MSRKFLFCGFVFCICKVFADSSYNVVDYNFFYDQFVCEEKNITSEVRMTPPCTENPPGPPKPTPPTPPSGPCPSSGSFRPFTTLPAESSCPVTECDILSPGTCGISAPTQLLDYFPFVIVNHSGQSDADVYISIYIPANPTPATPYDQYMQFNGSGQGLLTKYQPTTYLNNSLCTVGTTYSNPLSSFPVGPILNSRVLYIPNSGGIPGQAVLKSSRIFVSLGSPLNYFIDSTATLQITDSTSVDDNYFVLYDKVEFDLGSNNANNLFMNLTGVDFFGLPLEVKATYKFLGGTQYCNACATTGWPSGISFSNVFSGYQNYLTTLPEPFKTYWGDLVSTYINPDTTVSNLRIFSPATAMGSTQVQSNPSAVSFPTNYFLSSVVSNPMCSWFNAVWQGGTLANPLSYYMQKPSAYLILDATTSTYGSAVAKGYMYTNGSFVFTLSGGTMPAGSTITIPSPTSSKAFFTGAVSDYQPAITGSGGGLNAAVQAQVFKVFATSMIAGFFPINSLNTSVGEIDATYITNNSASYFQNNQTLENSLSYCECEENIPWYDFYSGSMLSIGNANRFYTSAYSDFLALDGTIVITDLQGQNAAAFATVYIHPCPTTLPDPYADTTSYTVQTLFQESDLTISYGTTSSGPWTAISNGGTVTLSGNAMYFQVQYKNGTYSGTTVVTQIAPLQQIFHPVLPLNGTITVNGSSVSISFGG